MSYSADVSAGPHFGPGPQKMGWGEASRRFFFTREGGALALKLLAMVGLVASVGDEPLDLIPGIDLLSFGDDILWVALPAWAIARIAWIRHRSNRQRGLS